MSPSSHAVLPPEAPQPVKGGVEPKWSSDSCTFCGVCEAVCPEKAIRVDKEKKALAFDQASCVYCGKCIKSCPTDAWQGKAGFVISFGGLYGNRIAIGRHFLPIVFEEEKLYEVVDTTLAFFEQYAKPSERFANCLDRVGWDKFEQEVEKIL